jgi:hypothetical protein
MFFHVTLQVLDLRGAPRCPPFIGIDFSLVTSSSWTPRKSSLLTRRTESLAPVSGGSGNSRLVRLLRCRRPVRGALLVRLAGVINFDLPPVSETALARLGRSHAASSCRRGWSARGCVHQAVPDGGAQSY